MDVYLTKQNAKGTTQFWKIKVEKEIIHIEWGIENGKVQSNIYTVQEGKQKRTREEQAIFEAKSLIHKKEKTGYENRNASHKTQHSPLPMLAKEYKGCVTLKSKDVAIQPKLDGIRCLANVKTGELWSRKQTHIDGLGHITNAIKKCSFPEHITWLDGELYTHGKTFNDISSMVRRTTNFTQESESIHYWVYDYIGTKPFQDRIHELHNVKKCSDDIVITPTLFVHVLEKSCLDQYHKKYTSDGFEGTMIRSVNSVYETGKRSCHLLKYKDCCQEEFVVIGFNQKKVVNDDVTLGSVILKDFDDSITFSATPTMTMAEKAEIWRNKSDYINQIATIKYFEKTPKGVPRFPRLIGFRHPDDC